MTTRQDLVSRRLRRSLRSPKGRLLLLLLGLAALATPATGMTLVIPTVVGAVLAATLLDLGLTRLRRGDWMLPDGAALSGLIVALVLSPREPWCVPVVGGALAVASKHLIRTPRLGRPHVFNPAAFALLACALLFSSAESWWGALPELPAPALLPLLAAGYYIADRVNKLPQVLSFAATYVGLLTFAALLTHGASPRLAELYRTPFVNAALFLAFFMLTDPPTSPNRTDEQIAFGFVVGLVTYGAFLALPGLTFLLLGLLSGNVWLAWRRMQRAGQTGGAGGGKQEGTRTTRRGHATAPVARSAALTRGPTCRGSVSPT